MSNLVSQRWHSLEPLKSLSLLALVYAILKTKEQTHLWVRIEQDHAVRAMRDAYRFDRTDRRFYTVAGSYYDYQGGNPAEWEAFIRETLESERAWDAVRREVYRDDV